MTDVVERFHILVYLFIILLRNMSELNWSFEALYNTLSLSLAVLTSELLVDWLKHAFLIKFNEFNWSSYEEWKQELAELVCFSYASALEKKCVPPKKFVDLPHALCQRVGFVALPLSCLFIRIFLQVIPRTKGRGDWIIMMLMWSCLLGFKLFIRVLLVWNSCNIVQRSNKKIAKR
jgi:hypothetical protein